MVATATCVLLPSLQNSRYTVFLVGYGQRLDGMQRAGYQYSLIRTWFSRGQRWRLGDANRYNWVGICLLLLRQFFANFAIAPSVSIWRWPRNASPADVTAGAPVPSSWGTPMAAWGSSTCDPAKYFKEMSIVMCVFLLFPPFPRLTKVRPAISRRAKVGLEASTSGSRRRASPSTRRARRQWRIRRTLRRRE